MTRDVREQWSAMEKVFVGKVATVTCAHGNTKLHPLAKVEVELDGAHIRVEAALSEELPVSVSLPDAHYVFLTRHCKRPLIFRVRVH